MSTDLASTFQLREDPHARLASVEASARLHAFAVSPGQTLAFGPDTRFNLSQLTLVFSFEPTWVPWTDAESPAQAPCVVALGTREDPGAVFRVSVTRELDALLIDSAATPSPVRVQGDFSTGAQIVLCLGPFTASALVRGTPEAPEAPFSLGSLVEDAVPRLTFGTEADPTLAAPFAGIVARVMLFDTNLYDKLHEQSQLASNWRNGRWDSFYAALSLASEAPFVSALVGVARSDDGEGSTPGFDFIPRDVLLPDASERWVLASSTHPPVRLTVPGHADHGIHSTFNLFCFTISDGKPCLWGDGGQCFTLTYAGKGVVRAVQAVVSRPNVLRATLRRVRPDTFELIPDDWSNSTEKVFATKTFPFGLGLEGVDPADLWPERIELVRVPAHYDATRNAARPVEQDQPFKGAFSKRLPQIGMSARGFNPARLSAFNPGATDGAQASEEFYVFRQPADDSRLYRVDFIATPYYLFSSEPNFKVSSGTTVAYQSSAEAMNSESTSLGLDVGVGETTLFSIGSKTHDAQETSGASESVLGVERSRELKYILTLDRRWVELNPNLVTCALEEADRQIAGETHPPPFRRLFTDYGTHYANAIVYGCQSAKIEMLDAITLGKMVQSGSSIEAALKIPVEEGTVGLKGGHETEEKSGSEESRRKESRTTIEVGSDADPMPVFLDLRPLWELLQPPYINDDRMSRTFEWAAKAWHDLKRERAAAPPQWETPLLVQVRFRSVRHNHKGASCFLSGRAFLAGVAKGSTWTIVAPKKPQQGQADPIWLGEILRVDDFKPSPMPLISLAIPRTGVTPAIGFTGHLRFTYTERIAETDISPFELQRLRVSVLARKLFHEEQPGDDAPFKFNEWAHVVGIPIVSDRGTDWSDVDALGQPLAQDAVDPPSFYTELYEAHVLRAKLSLDHVEPGPTFSSQTLTAAGGALSVDFDVRIVDPLNLLDDDSAAGYRYG